MARRAACVSEADAGLWLAAWRMQSAVRRLVAEESGGGRQLGLRVGLNTGEVVAGVQAHLSYTVVGDTVNTASRLSDVAGPGAERC